MCVNLRRSDVGVTEHLLQRAQVAATRQQMGGKRVTKGVRAHASLQPRTSGVALDDLVQPLPRQPAAALVDEHLLLVAQSHQPRPAPLEVRPQCVDRLGPDRHDPLL